MFLGATCYFKQLFPRKRKEKSPLSSETETCESYSNEVFSFPITMKRFGGSRKTDYIWCEKVVRIATTWILSSTELTGKYLTRCVPPDTVTNFEWKDYCPAVFRQLQDLDNINYAGYMLSVCRYETIREIVSSGKNGCPFYLSDDNRFVVKTLHKSEIKAFLAMLPNYYRHVKKFRGTLLTKFYGLHAVRPVGGPKVYFIIMRNIFQSDLCIHRRFDLKGSSHGRSIRSNTLIGESTTLKDLDLDFCFYVDPLTRHRVFTQIKHDCEFLEVEGVMNYSLLLGLHLEAPTQDFEGRSLNHDSSCRRVEQEFTSCDDYIQATGPSVNLGLKIRARAVRKPAKEKGKRPSYPGIAAKECCNVILFIGIVDILQGYNMIKRFEQTYKSLHFVSRSISVVNPKVYAARFQDFLSKVFPAEK
ncbi:hypothetical protein NE237_012875 [Protea cynaroides]|uniref:1-phosphatidylinositol-4-phosphate 5-kinase n=1 Tax=Protea cynaroides TaxID=273540 RepID=A0A9Q0GXL3_9MAGN|nr:hypothetical protein NE237_012875 [Protea cynaroides]